MSIRKIIVLVGALLTMTACGGNQADNDISSDESFSSQVDSSPQASSEAASIGQVSSEPVHSHTYSDEWSHDGIYHWHSPTCGGA